MARSDINHATAFFFAHVFPEPNSGCWLWDGMVHASGYGKLTFEGRKVSAHRFSWMIANGPIPEGLGILHKCDVKCCVNPDHLYAGTHRQNMDDAVARRRMNRWSGRRRGGRNPAARINEEIVLQIRRKLDEGLIDREVAPLFGVCETTVGNIRRGSHWKHVKFNG